MRFLLFNKYKIFVKRRIGFLNIVSIVCFLILKLVVGVKLFREFFCEVRDGFGEGGRW